MPAHYAALTSLCNLPADQTRPFSFSNFDLFFFLLILHHKKSCHHQSAVISQRNTKTVRLFVSVLFQPLNTSSMDLCSIWPFTQNKSLPLKQAFLEPIPLCESTLIQTLIRVGKELIASFYAKKVQFQRTNFRYLIWKVEIVVLLLNIYMIWNLVLSLQALVYAVGSFLIYFFIQKFS